MKAIVLSKDQARQFALDIFDVLIQDIKARKEKQAESTNNNDSGTNQQGREEGRAA